MFNKSFLLDKIVNSLLRNEFEVFLSRGCFDIVAKKEFLMLIKSLINIDGLDHDQALSLRTISHFLSAYPLIISMKSNRQVLSDNTVYSRFEVPVVTPGMLEGMIDEEVVSYVQSAKGRHTVLIDSEALRQKRKEAQLTLADLSEKAGISKKALYEIEKRRVDPTAETVKRLETALDMDLKKPYTLKSPEPAYMEPRDQFQSRISEELYRIGIDNSSVCSAPFEIVGRENFLLVTSLSKNHVEIKREAGRAKRLSSILSSQWIFISGNCKEQSVEGMPVFTESELSNITSPKELNEIIDERAK